MKRISMLAIGGLGAACAASAVTLPKFITSNMVVEQQSTLTIPGHAAPGAKVTLRADWSGKPELATKADAEGRFEFRLATPKAGGPYTIVIDDGEKTPTAVLNNVMSGEVWLCSGQSNMEFPVRGWTQIMDADEVVAQASLHPDVRLLQIKKQTAFTPQTDAEVNMGGWVEASPATMDFSAIAYLFALQLQEELGVSVGVIDATWGGTPAEAWTSLGGLEGIAGFEPYIADLKNSGFEREGVRKAYADRVEQWNRRMLGKEADFNLAQAQPGWAKMPVPGYWEESVLPGYDGIVYAQRVVTLPAEAAGKELTLNLGPIDNEDVTYFNGKQVGASGSWTDPRCYRVDGSLVKAGDNVITIRITDFDGGGGMGGNAGQYTATVGGKSYQLDGDWSYLPVLDFAKAEPRPVSPDGSSYPTVLYNAMIHPLQVMPVKGVLWYQGCANVGRDQQYEPLFKSMIGDWRKLFGSATLPFYFVQLAGFQKPELVQPESAWAALRNSQAKALELPATGMAVAIDLGNPVDIHPTNKQEVARRLGLMALNRQYGRKQVDQAPRCTASRPEDGRMVLTFDAPVASPSGTATGFILGDANGRWAYATTEIADGGTTVILSSPLISAPTAARYGWADYPGCNLRGATGLPVAPFATDK